uniref:Annexin n=1 Tax=Globodera rostochiensis TaxID=31243 RepID=A0A914I2S0_GLORO
MFFYPKSVDGINLFDETIFEDADEHDAKFLNKTMKEFRDNKDILLEILITRSNKQLRTIKSKYKQLFGHELSAEIASNTKGSYNDLLFTLLKADRDESNKTDRTKAKKDAVTLYKAGEKRLGTDEEVFTEIFSTQNVQQLRFVFDEYQKLTGNSIEKALDSEFSGDEFDALMDIVSFVRKGPSGVLSRLMQKAIKGTPNDELLVHLIYSYKRMNLMEMLQDEFKHGFKGPLSEAVKDKAKTTIFKNTLINLITG